MASWLLIFIMTMNDSMTINDIPTIYTPNDTMPINAHNDFTLLCE